MELGHYGWGTDIKVFQQHSVFINKTAPATTNYGVLNLGDAPFDGISTGFFSGSSGGTLYAANVRSTFTGSIVDYQIDGTTVLKLFTNPGTNSTQLSLLSKSIANRKSQIILGNSGHVWAIGTDVAAANVQSFFIYDDDANANRLLIDSSGNVTFTATGSGGRFLTLTGSAGAGSNFYTGLNIINTSIGSRKAAIALGGSTDATRWGIGVDIAGSDFNNFFIYDGAAPATRFFIDNLGNIVIGSDIGDTLPTPLASLDIRNSDPNLITLIVRAGTLPTADLQQWRTHDFTVLAKVSAYGDIIAKNVSMPDDLLSIYWMEVAI